MVPRLILAGVVLSMTACASQPSYKYTKFYEPPPPEQRVSLDALNRVLLDCPNKDRQVAWFNQQISNPASEPGTDKEFVRKAKSMIWQLRSTCPGTY